MELEFVNWLAQQFSNQPNLLLGIGDDAAVLENLGAENLVVTVDTLADGAHFDLSRQPAELIGRKAVAVNLSDLAAMGAEPVAVVVGIVLPTAGGAEIAKRLYAGMRPLLSEFNIALAGGDTNSWNGPLTISVTALGKAPPDQIWRRSGARAGDNLIVTGDLGGSILGKHLSFQPRLRESRLLAASHKIHAAIDISDGLLLDLHRLTSASACGAELIFEQIPISDAARKLAATDDSESTPLDHALSDGEDFELLMAVSPSTWQAIQSDNTIDFQLTKIGNIIADAGIFQRLADGSRVELAPKGFEHKFD